LKNARVDYFRAGIWKARTRHDSFEGIGDTALPWLKAAGVQYGLRTATEVASAKHVEAALQHGIDLLWVGARTTVNPFSVQEIANAMRGVDVPMLVKNPTSPDVPLWMGALERLSNAGVRALGAIHRGVAVTASAPYRNAPMWGQVLEMRRLMPELPLICDPSHICGRRDLLAGIAQRAMDLGMDGLMIESHPRPDHAWSDAAQQVTPERFSEILSELILRKDTSGDAEFLAAIEALRGQIDRVDHDLVALLARRMEIVDSIAERKRDNSVTALQPARWSSLLSDRLALALSLGLDEAFTKALYDLIHQESIRRQLAPESSPSDVALPEPR
jgi:chorismate mutase